MAETSMPPLQPTRARKYCAVYGCLNTKILRPDLSYFTLPQDGERRSKWLQLISREDIFSSKPTNYTVCEEHFNVSEVLPNQYNKILKKTAIPSLRLPDHLNKENGTQVPTHQDECVQTEEIVIETGHKNTQTNQYLLFDTLPVKKLRLELSQCRKKIKFHEKKKTDKDTFHKLCDKFLTKELAELAKGQTSLKLHHRGNRYSQDYTMFCLNLYYTSPQAYRLLQTALCLPCPKTIKKYIPIKKEINEIVLSTQPIVQELSEKTAVKESPSEASSELKRKLVKKRVTKKKVVPKTEITSTQQDDEPPIFTVHNKQEICNEMTPELTLTVEPRKKALIVEVLPEEFIVTEDG